MASKGPRVSGPRLELEVADTTWLTLGQLRALVAKADELGWIDESLVSAKVSEHYKRHDVMTVRALLIEGGPGA